MALSDNEALIEFLAKKAVEGGRRIDIADLPEGLRADLHRAQAVIGEIEGFKNAVAARLRDCETEYLRLVARALNGFGRSDVAKKITEAINSQGGPEGVAVSINWVDNVMDYHFLDSPLTEAVKNMAENIKKESMQ
jgi:hypothetical protein